MSKSVDTYACEEDPAGAAAESAVELTEYLAVAEVAAEAAGCQGRSVHPAPVRLWSCPTWGTEMENAGQQRARSPPPPTAGNLRKSHMYRAPTSYLVTLILTAMANSPLQPPGPFSDFEFSFDPSLSNIFPNPPPLPPSADLFSPSETTGLLGFLDNFTNITWDFDATDYTLTRPEQPLNPSIAPYSNPHLNTTPDPSTSTRLRPITRAGSIRLSSHVQDDQLSRSNSTPSGSPNSNSPPQFLTQEPSARSATRSKPLLSSPQKRLNHIMSEQKRRNAIRDGYAQLITLLAPAGAPGIDMPTRGRPKGSGSGKGQTKGKSGVLFRAVEYCRWLEEGKDALRAEVLRVEAAAGIHHY